MSKPTEPRDGTTGPRFRLDEGLSVLEQWSATAVQSQRNMVYKALFSVTDGSVFRNYIVLPDFEQPRELSILLNEDLVIKIYIRDIDSFEIRYIGSLGSIRNVGLGGQSCHLSTGRGRGTPRTAS